MKTILCVCGPANTGKTETIYELAKRLVSIALSTPGSVVMQGARQLNSVDAIETINKTELIGAVIITVNGKTCGLLSLGDIGEDLAADLEYMADFPCDVIICAARTRGATTWAVHETAEAYQYELLWTSPYIKKDVYSGLPFSRLNGLKAVHIQDLLAQLGIFP